MAYVAYWLTNSAFKVGMYYTRLSYLSFSTLFPYVVSVIFLTVYSRQVQPGNRISDVEYLGRPSVLEQPPSRHCRVRFSIQSY